MQCINCRDRMHTWQHSEVAYRCAYYKDNIHWVVELAMLTESFKAMSDKNSWPLH